MTIFNKIKDEYLNARKERKDTVKINLYSSLVSDISMVGKNDGNRDPTDAECINVIKKYIKNAEVVFSNLIMKYEIHEVEARDNAEHEIAILTEYLPKQLTEAEIHNYVQGAVLMGCSNLGAVMVHFKNNFPGQYDGKVLSTIAKEYFKG